MSSRDQPTLVFPPAPEEPVRRRGRGWAWGIVLVVVGVLVAAAAMSAEWFARSAVEGGVRTLVVSQLGLAGQEVHVEAGGLVVPQLISGTLDEVTVTASDVSVGPISGDVTVTVTGMPIRADAPAEAGAATVRLDEQQLRALLGTVEGFPADAVGIADPDVTVSAEIAALGAAFPVGVALAPGAAHGEVVLTPRSFTLGEAQVTAEELQERLGGFADTLAREWHVCVAEHLPAALTLTSVAVDGPELVAGFDIDGRVVVDSALRQKGACG